VLVHNLVSYALERRLALLLVLAVALAAVSLAGIPLSLEP